MSGEAQHIHPLWVAVFQWQSCLLYLALLPRRKGRAQCVWIMLALLAVQCAYMTLAGEAEGWAFDLGMVGLAGLSLLSFLLLYAGNVSSGVYYGARAFVLGGFAVSLAWQMFVFDSRRFARLGSPAVRTVFLLLAGAVIYTAVWALERVHRHEMRELSIPCSSCAGSVLIAVIIYVLSRLSYTTVGTPLAAAVGLEAFNIRTMVHLGGVIILYVCHLQLCESYIQREMSALQNVLDMQYASYQLSQESVDMVNRRYHDLKHQIAALRAEIGAEQKLDCLDQIEREIRVYEGQNRTGNKVLDAILTTKAAHCLEHGIAITCAADGSAMDFMGVADVSALLGNALDNAIEGVNRLPDPDQRIIRLAVERWKGFLRVRIENRCVDGIVVGGSGLPWTTKADKGQHGYGLKSIRATAEKYGGTVSIRAEGGWFTLGVLIPLSPEYAGTGPVK